MYCIIDIDKNNKEFINKLDDLCAEYEYIPEMHDKLFDAFVSEEVNNRNEDPDGYDLDINQKLSNEEINIVKESIISHADCLLEDVHLAIDNEMRKVISFDEE